MSYNFINEALNLEVVNECIYDTSVGYEADFSENGNIDDWTAISLIHTYGVWNGFLFGTLYGSGARMGLANTFTPVAAETHYTVKISMKLNPLSTSTPTTARLMWQTINNPSWGTDQSLDFEIYPDNVWHTYILNMGNAQWWQGDINNLRLYPMLDGDDGDEFFIRAVKIDSVSTFQCLNPTCSFYNSYEHPCQGIGRRAYCQAQPKESNNFDIVAGVNDELIVNINRYGSEIITLVSGTGISGDSLAKDIIKKVSQVDVGGYAETNVTYSEFGRFKIYSGTYTGDSTVSVEDSSAAETLGFFSAGTDVSTTSAGEDPATGFKPKSSFKIKSFQLLELFDSSLTSYVEFNPFIYSVEGGRRDWAQNGLGSSTLYSEPDEAFQQLIYSVIENDSKTIIDFNHPFNASGKIKKIYLVGSMEAEDGSIRTGCKLKVLRRNKEGQLRVIHTIDVPNRTGGTLYSKTQEYVAVDCNLLVNKGDFLGAYNIDIYMGKSYSGEADALYFQTNDEASGTFDPGELLGNGNAGFFFYARGDDTQRKLHIDIDLGKRVNISDIDIKGRSMSNIMEYNIARCVDIDWRVDLFAGTHDTGYYDTWNSWWVNYNHVNVSYGKDKLTDGIYGNENGESADSYSANDADGLTPTNPQYFYVNGDGEWVGIHYHIGQYKGDPYVRNFEEDPVAFTILFPSNREKPIFKSVIYFKERQNFRTFALSYYLGPDITSGDADDPHFKYIPEYSAVTVDSVRHHEDSTDYAAVAPYLFANPSDASIVFDGNTLENYEAVSASELVDWNVITHEFEPLRCKGFRIYTDYHKSTKINEMELYCYVENEGTNIADSVAIKYSQYEDLWIDGNPEANDDGTSTVFVGSTPQYLRIEIEPVTELKLSDLIFSVNVQDVYVGRKGCEYNVLLDHTRRGVRNQANKVDFKNVYDKPFDLYVDIPQDAEYDKGLTFYSEMNNEESVLNPEVGPGAFYVKKEDYPLVLRDNNCAINCPVYGLKNIVEGAVAYSSVDGDYWEEHSTLSSGVSVDFSNFKSKVRTVINLPTLYTDRYWKIGFLCEDQTMNIREACIYDGDTLLDYVGYHDPGVAWPDTVSADAPHLDNGSLTGSYYVLEDESYITFDVGSQKSITKIVLYNDNTTLDYSNSGCGIDRYTKLCLHCDQEDGLGITDFIDSSYFPKTVHARGNTYIDNNSYFGNGAVLFDGLPTTYLEVGYDDDFDFDRKRYTLDFWVKFNSLPVVGDYCVFLKNWDGAIPNSTGNDYSLDRAWAFILRNDAGTYKLQMYYVAYLYPHWQRFRSSRDWTPSLNVWYNLAMCRGPYDVGPGEMTWYRNGSSINNSSGPQNSSEYRSGNQPVVIGENVDGYMDEIRISRGDLDGLTYGQGKGGGRYKWASSFTPFDHAYQRFYGVSVYTSLDNSIYGKYCGADVKYEVDDPGVYYYSDNVWSSPFYSYFAIDLGSRYALQIVRNYAGANLLSCSITSNTAYSDDDVSDINAVTFAGSYDDARWIRFSMYSGDSTDRYIRKLGIYPSITSYVAPPGGSYNHLWDDLGTSITAYTPGKNVAFNATVSGSSNFGELYLGKITDGIIGDTISDAWGSDTASSQWIEISFDGTYSIYRVMMHHGYSEDDSYLIEDYTIQVSTDGSTYTTIFDITGNTDYEREHALSTPVSASSLKINITSYQTGDAIYLPQGGDEFYAYFQGAVLREVEVNEYYGFDYISSETYPIIALNLLDQFQISGHSLVGLDPEDASTDWDNSEGNFAWADSVLDDPKKIDFSSWGSGAHTHHDRWVAIKRNTATNLDSGPDYLKHAKILVSEDPTPCEYHWWWSADLSTLSNDYGHVKNSLRSLKIDYPTSSGTDHVFLIEGDTFGTDEKASWRDALSFWIYIDDLDNLDDYGYFYFGDVNSSKYIDYRWDISFLKPHMESGWNNMFLRFKSATDVVYVPENDDQLPDARIVSNRELKSFGIRFRGVGNPITMYLDSMKIERNQFMDFGKFDYGLYISGDDYLSAPLADFKLTQGTVEFWLRPDYTSNGSDIYRQLKYRSLFHFANVPNDVFGAMIGFDGIVVYVGNLSEEPIVMTVEADYWSIDDTFHLAFVYSNDGTSIDTDGSTIRVYFNNYEIAKISDTWGVNDSKKFRFFIGGRSLHAVKESYECSSIDGVISNFKIHNYCKTDFSNSMSNVEEAREKLWKPNELIEISKDNVTFQGVGDPNLPLIYDSVPVGDTVSTYVRSSLPDTLTGREAREASILASWFISV